MSLLYKTISSFFPNEAMCAFVGEPWFIENHELQLDVLQLCQAGYACMLFSKTPDHETFKMQMAYFINRYVDTTYRTNRQDHYSKFVDNLTLGITDGDYLLTRGWFCRSPYRHVNVYIIELNGCSGLIDCFRGDFDEHIENIMQFILLCYRLYGENARTMLVSGKCDEIMENFKLNDNNAADDDGNYDAGVDVGDEW